MPPQPRPGFLSLFALFLGRMPSVWLGGIATALAGLIVAAVFSRREAVITAIAVVLVAVCVEFAIDRRRGIGRRLLFRGARLSGRRVAALVLAMGLIASASTALFALFGGTVQQVTPDDLRKRPGKQRRAS